ncbi:MAG: N-acetylmuramoyl-L-alanine amidase [Ardenticatenaceae bacterium]|nr:N-acetylmuramoyl-L-alanine amidase [Ardenticatenaceae bacterium]
MCDLCGYSRRRFLVAGGTAVLLAACGVNEGGGATAVPPPISPMLTPTFVPTPTLRTAVTPLLEPTIVRQEMPHFGGVVAAIDERSVMLAAPVGTRQFELAVEIQVAVDDSVVIWVEGEQVTAVQKLPPFSATEEIPDGWVQGEVTGEKRPLGQFDLITRAGWGAGAANWQTSDEAGAFDAETNPIGHLIYPEPLSDWLNTLVVHHSALDYLAGPREIQRLHILENGFGDVGYHFLVDGLGQVYEGRPLNERGAHTGGYNTGTVGICLLGNFEIVQPVMAQLNSLHQVAVYLRDTVGIMHLAGHRGFQPEATVCPGVHLWPLLSDVATEAGLIWGTDGYVVPDWAS